jgi:hypothetical protein
LALPRRSGEQKSRAAALLLKSAEGLLLVGFLFFFLGRVGGRDSYGPEHCQRQLRAVFSSFLPWIDELTGIAAARYDHHYMIVCTHK